MELPLPSTCELCQQPGIVHVCVVTDGNYEQRTLCESHARELGYADLADQQFPTWLSDIEPLRRMVQFVKKTGHWPSARDLYPESDWGAWHVESQPSSNPLTKDDEPKLRYLENLVAFFDEHGRMPTAIEAQALLGE